MGTRFVLTRLTLGHRKHLPIDESFFNSVRAAKNGLVAIVEIEEKFDLLLSNYELFERQLLELALHSSIFRDLSWTVGRTDTTSVNRCLSNLLASGRLYVDQVQHDLSGVYGKSKKDAFESALNAARAKWLGFRAMEAVRNYMQHRSLPVQRLNYGSRLDGEPNTNSKFSFRVCPSLDVEYIKEDGKFNATVLKELTTLGRFVALTPLVREYVEGVSEIHDCVRGFFQDDLLGWDKTMTDALELASREFEGKTIGLAVAIMDEESRVSDSEQVFDHLIKYRKEKQAKNSVLVNLARRYVTSSTDQSDA